MYSVRTCSIKIHQSLYHFGQATTSLYQKEIGRVPLTTRVKQSWIKVQICYPQQWILKIILYNMGHCGPCTVYLLIVVVLLKPLEVK